MASALNRFFSITLVALAIFVMPGTAFAGPPFVTDDPIPVDYQHWEFYIASINSKSDGDWSGTAPHFEINYGVITNVQLHMIIPLGYDLPAEGTSHYGLADIELGTKIRFIQQSKYVPDVAIFPLLELPTGRASHNLGNGHMQVFLPVWLQKDWGTWTLYGGGGYGINSLHKNQNWGFVGAVLQKQVIPYVAIGAELFHQTTLATDFPFTGTMFNIGTTIDFSDHQHLLFSAGRSINGPTDFQCYIAYQLTFDNSVFHFWKHSGN